MSGDMKLLLEIAGVTAALSEVVTEADTHISVIAILGTLNLLRTAITTESKLAKFDDAIKEGIEILLKQPTPNIK